MAAKLLRLHPYTRIPFLIWDFYDLWQWYISRQAGMDMHGWVQNLSCDSPLGGSVGWVSSSRNFTPFCYTGQAITPNPMEEPFTDEMTGVLFVTKDKYPDSPLVRRDVSEHWYKPEGYTGPKPEYLPESPPVYLPPVVPLLPPWLAPEALPINQPTPTPKAPPYKAIPKRTRPDYAHPRYAFDRGYTLPQPPRSNGYPTFEWLPGQLPRVSYPTSGNPKRPPPKEKEVKSQSQKVGWALATVALEVTEWGDLVEVLHDALPQHLQADGGIPQKVEAIWRNPEHIDLSKALDNYGANEVEDQSIGAYEQARSVIRQMTGLRLPSIGQLSQL